MIAQLFITVFTNYSNDYVSCFLKMNAHRKYGVLGNFAALENSVHEMLNIVLLVYCLQDRNIAM